jgi:hypothetical protein
MPDQHDTIAEGAKRFLEVGESVCATLRAAPRGFNTAMAGGIARPIGQRQVRRVHEAAEQAGIRIAYPMALALTQRRLLSLKVGTSMGGGKVTEVEELLSAVPLSSLESIQAKRVGLGGTLTLTPVGGAPIKLECRVGGARALAKAFTQSKSTP